MNSYEKFHLSCQANQSLLCVGLDTDINKMPSIFSKDLKGMLEFNKTIIESTSDLVCSYKMNFAFYEQYGTEGFEILKKTFELIPNNIFTIADAKRGDIGNTTECYAKSVYDYFRADSVTASPYMGFDSISPFMKYKDKMVFLLALTSNNGSQDFQRLQCEGKPLFKQVIEKSAKEYSYENLGFVIGATHPDELKEVRDMIPNNPLLIPGVGTQGGDAKAVLAANSGGNAMINVSRAVIYPQGEGKFADLVRVQAEYFKTLLSI